MNSARIMNLKSIQFNLMRRHKKNYQNINGKREEK